jgi:hypothetical protein
MEPKGSLSYLYKVRKVNIWEVSSLHFIGQPAPFFVAAVYLTHFKPYLEPGGTAVHIFTCIWDVLGSCPWKRLSTLTEGFHNFLQALQANSGIVH